MNADRSGDRLNQPTTTIQEKSMYFEIVTASGGYRARIRGGNHEIMFVSEVYTTKYGAQNAISVVKASAFNAPVYDRT